MAGDDNSVLETLSEGQKDCLRLVGQHFSSKEIARELKISPHTVDQRLKRATAILSANSRFDAARMLMNGEKTAFFFASPPADTQYESLVYQRPDLLSDAQTGNQSGSTESAMPTGDTSGSMLNEVHASYVGLAKTKSQTQSFWSALLEGKRENNLTVGMRLLLMVLIMVLGLLGFAILVSAIEGLSRLT